MIILDTNVVSEAMKREPNPMVRTWLDNQVAETLYLSSVAVAELLFGIAALPAGKRKNTLHVAFEGLLALFRDRVLPFDIAAARHYAELAVSARSSGQGFPTPDGYVAAIAASRGYIVASRDVGPYEAAGIAVINPWG
jgi:hypothetical protein